MWSFSESDCAGKVEGGSEDVDSGGAIVNHSKQKSARFSKVKGKLIWLQPLKIIITIGNLYIFIKLNFSLLVDVNSCKLSQSNRSHVSGEEGPTTGQKKSVIGVVLREDEILPGHSKINVSLGVFCLTFVCHKLI